MFIFACKSILKFLVDFFKPILVGLRVFTYTILKRMRSLSSRWDGRAPITVTVRVQSRVVGSFPFVHPGGKCSGVFFLLKIL